MPWFQAAADGQLGLPARDPRRVRHFRQPQPRPLDPATPLRDFGSDQWVGDTERIAHDFFIFIFFSAVRHRCNFLFG